MPRRHAHSDARDGDATSVDVRDRHFALGNKPKKCFDRARTRTAQAGSLYLTVPRLSASRIKRARAGFYYSVSKKWENFGQTIISP